MTQTSTGTRYVVGKTKTMPKPNIFGLEKLAARFVEPQHESQPSVLEDDQLISHKRPQISVLHGVLHVSLDDAWMTPAFAVDVIKNRRADIAFVSLRSNLLSQALKWGIATEVELEKQHLSSILPRVVIGCADVVMPDTHEIAPGFTKAIQDASLCLTPDPYEAYSARFGEVRSAYGSAQNNPPPLKPADSGSRFSYRPTYPISDKEIADLLNGGDSAEASE